MKYLRIIMAALALTVVIGDAVALDAAHAGIHNPRLWVSRHGVVQHTTLPHCAVEDGGPDLPCTWNVGPRQDGNGGGLSYWVGRDQRVHYVWNLDPTVGTRWHWVSSGLADALAESTRPMAGTRPWERCATKKVPFPGSPYGYHRWVKCPDGLQLMDA